MAHGTYGKLGVERESASCKTYSLHPLLSFQPLAMIFFTTSHCELAIFFHVVISFSQRLHGKQENPGLFLPRWKQFFLLLFSSLDILNTWSIWSNILIRYWDADWWSMIREGLRQSMYSMKMWNHLREWLTQ